MILIQSNNNDYSTNKVIDWINLIGEKVFRLNGEDFVENFIYEGNSLSFSFNDVAGSKIEIKFGKISSYWYRRGFWNISAPKLKQGNRNVINVTNEFYKLESNGLEDFVNYFTHNKSIKKIGNVKDNSLNKLRVLELAKSENILVPETIITTNKSDVIAFIKKQNGKIITKAINQAPIIELEQTTLYAYTSLFSETDIKDCPDFFYPTLFQQAIDKKFELRIFYLNGKFYTTAIFSQNDEKTKYDFRNYNFEKPNRTPPFNLPIDIKKKLNKLMCKLNLSSGSIDMIYSKKEEFVFLEVNPIGQFHQVSYPGNFYLEKEIAKELCK